MPNINIMVAGKIATNMSPGEVIICGNSDYTMTFDFDSEWSAVGYRTARFIYVKGGKVDYQEKLFTGNVVEAPILSNITEVYVGVYAGDLKTTTPAKVLTKRSVLCGLGTHEDPDEDVYAQILALLQESRGVHIGSNKPTDPNVMAWIDPDGEPTSMVVTDATAGAKSLTLTPENSDTEWRYVHSSGIASLAIASPGTLASDAEAYYSIVFLSGTTATTITNRLGAYFTGDECEKGVFTPAASKTYDVGIYWNGLTWQAVVRGV